MSKEKKLPKFGALTKAQVIRIGYTFVLSIMALGPREKSQSYILSQYWQDESGCSFFVLEWYHQILA